eukprot:TRINITY_DN60544_c0_g1_i1.p1 TRINITY_DN60544_c0_g1~~TRINITY_DN60544_c0_g1_i1.p1  ORF type:complete len:102 (-),score=2.91 TRINITY_DN60544_c0_g1_i1:11-316(-)
MGFFAHWRGERLSLAHACFVPLRLCAKQYRYASASKVKLQKRASPSPAEYSPGRSIRKPPRTLWWYPETSIPRSKRCQLFPQIGRAVQQECRDRSRMPSSA